MKGSVVMATLSNGSRLEGILDRVDLQERRVLLKMVFVWPEATSAVPQEHAFRDFALSDLVALSAAAVNFAEATGGGGFATDTDITAATGATGRAGGMRELARWEGGEDGEGAGLEDDMPPGSRHWDQFATNQKLFGVVTSFDESAYTTVLDRESAEFKTRHTEAERLAREIERGTGSTSNPHLAEERGAVFDDSQLDEEDRYGAVVRDQRRSPKGAVSYKEAAAAGGSKSSPHGKGTAAVVQMPLSTTSSRSPSGQSPSPSAETGEEPSPPRPRKSIASLEQSVDLETFAQAMEVVETNTGVIQRRLSQAAETDPSLASALQEQHRREQFERQKRDATDHFKAFSEKISGKMSLSDAGSPTTSSTSARLNPNAADFVPSQPSMPCTSIIIIIRCQQCAHRSSHRQPLCNARVIFRLSSPIAALWGRRRRPLLQSLLSTPSPRDGLHDARSPHEHEHEHGLSPLPAPHFLLGRTLLPLQCSLPVAAVQAIICPPPRR